MPDPALLHVSHANEPAWITAFAGFTADAFGWLGYGDAPGTGSAPSHPGDEDVSWFPWRFWRQVG